MSKIEDGTETAWPRPLRHRCESADRSVDSRPPGVLRDDPTARRDRDRMRRRFFAEAGWIATRYRIGPEAVFEHVETARQALPGRSPAGTIWIEDVVLATACCRGVAIAWTDLTSHVEPALRRAAASRLPDAEAAGTVAMFWRSMRRRTLEGTSGHGALEAPALQEFAGQRSLQSWLVERLLAQLDWSAPPGRRFGATISTKVSHVGG